MSNSFSMSIDKSNSMLNGIISGISVSSGSSDGSGGSGGSVGSGGSGGIGISIMLI